MQSLYSLSYFSFCDERDGEKALVFFAKLPIYRGSRVCGNSNITIITGIPILIIRIFHLKQEKGENICVFGVWCGKIVIRFSEGFLQHGLVSESVSQPDCEAKPEQVREAVRS